MPKGYRMGPCTGRILSAYVFVVREPHQISNARSYMGNGDKTKLASIYLLDWRAGSIASISARTKRISGPRKFAQRSRSSSGENGPTTQRSSSYVRGRA